MPTPILGVATTIGEGPEGGTGSTTGPYKRTALSIPLCGPGTLEDEEAELPFLEFDLGPPPELGPEVNHFLQELASKSREDSESNSSSEPPAEEHKRWVMWRWWALDMPSWWQELVKIPEVEDFQELAQKIWASFELPQRMSKLHHMENTTWLPQCPNVSAGWISSHCQIQSSPAGISKRNSWRWPCLCTGSPVLGREIQPAYPGPTTPFGGEHPGVEGSDGAIHFLPWWHHLGWCSLTRRIPGGPAKDDPLLKGLPGRKQTPLGSLWMNPVLPRPQVWSKTGG